MSYAAAGYAKDLSEEILRLEKLSEALMQADDIIDKIRVLDSEECVGEFSSLPHWMKGGIDKELVLKSLLSIKQFYFVFSAEGITEQERRKKYPKLIHSLLLIENFYQEIGGLVGYQKTVLEFLFAPKPRFSVSQATCHAPLGFDLSSPNPEVDEMIFHSIDKMDRLAEIYPVGGAADRLRLQDPHTGSLIPAAMLSFNGQTLLGKLISDLQVREYLYYKLKGKQITLPVAMMTSREKDNHDQVIRLCEQNHWFNRPEEKFSFFCQPLVPVVTREGNWLTSGPMNLVMKPGGHGVIWKLARDSGVMHWFQEQGVDKAIVRQINNPISSEDYHLLAFSGYGLKENKKFGFASCERQVKASEGINVLVEEKKEEEFCYTLTNIEYCDFNTYNIQDEPAQKGGHFSKFPSNTNLLFVDLPSIVEALETYPLPGMLVNVKKGLFLTDQGEMEEKEVARLESTMQNVADFFQRKSSHALPSEKWHEIDSYITFNKRQKTISATKKEFSLGSSLLETPEGCFSDVLSNARDLLENSCSFELPALKGKVESFTSPSFLFDYHRALGPIYSIIGKKLRGGCIEEKSEFRLQISECDIENLRVSGSFLIEASQVMGAIDESNMLVYSETVGRCRLKNVEVSNRGIDYSKENIFWKPLIFRDEVCKIVLEGSSEFIAEDVTFTGDLEVVVEDGYKVTARQFENWVIFVKEKVSRPSWKWKYWFDEAKTLQMRKESF